MIDQDPFDNLFKEKERDLELAFCNYVVSKGGRAYKLKEEGRRGWVDRTILWNGCVWFFEFKRPDGSLSAQQVGRIEELKQLGQVVLVFDDLRDATDHFDKLRAKHA